MTRGYLAIVLHAHLPFIKHPEYESFLEENWLFEAITDTYIPLIDVFDGLIKDNVDFRITVSLSPTLINMLADELLIQRYLKHLEKLIRLSELEIDRTRDDARTNKLARMYHGRFLRARHVFVDKYGNNLLNAFRKFGDLGRIEFITSCATHALLPLMDLHPSAIRGQVKIALDTFKETFGSFPEGFWLPECAYHPGHDKILAEFGIKYFFVETHGIMNGTPGPEYGVYSPYVCESGVAVFGRDMESSRAVWSATEGYPADRDYREYYRDIGFDLDYEYIRPFINGCGARTNTGIKYHKVTGNADKKEIYDRKTAIKVASRHANDFIINREKQVKRLSGTMDRAPVIVSPYDAELFGHWWFEGPEWLDFLLRKVHRRVSSIKTITPSEYLKRYGSFPVITPSMSSWGYKGYHEVWIDDSNDWIYRHLHKITELMVKAAEEHKVAGGLKKRVLNQMARELLLAQSSDWAFIMKTDTFADYATKRTKEHIGRFLVLYDQLREENIDLDMLIEAENKYNLFENIDYSMYAMK
ncbi:MAG: 1,4-alpha-glucan branching protein domain-containing protein [Candidatus Omnitrophota bacterium]